MSNEIDFFYTKNALELASEMDHRLGISSKPISMGRFSGINPERKFLVFNGDGYQHHLTRDIVRNLKLERNDRGMRTFSYVHIDAHDDITPESEGDDNSHSSFVLGIKKDIGKKVFILEEGLTGERNLKPNFFTVKGPEEWGFKTDRIFDRDVYLNIDLDVLDWGSGIHHLFPQKPIGFNMERLIWNIEKIAKRHKIIGVDLTGFSKKGATEKQVEESLENIAKISGKFIEIFS